MNALFFEFKSAYLCMVYQFRTAQQPDLPYLVGMLSDDALGKQRENPDQLEGYQKALAQIEQDPCHHILLMEVQTESGLQICGMLQLSYLPSLTYQGSWRAQIEGVRVHQDFRRQGLGKVLIQHALEQARAWGCRMVQLTTDKQRPESLRFYESLGFMASHEGCKLKFDEAPEA